MATEKSPADIERNPLVRTVDEQERRLDEALDATFPASDPVTVGEETGDEPPQGSTERQTPRLDVNLVNELARELREIKKL